MRIHFSQRADHYSNLAEAEELATVAYGPDSSDLTDGISRAAWVR
jgi:hypothetical protein